MCGHMRAPNHEGRVLGRVTLSNLLTELTANSLATQHIFSHSQIYCTWRFSHSAYSRNDVIHWQPIFIDLICSHKTLRSGFSPWCTVFHDFATACKHRWKSELASTFCQQENWPNGTVFMIFSNRHIARCFPHYLVILLTRLSDQNVWFRIKILRKLQLPSFS